MRKWIKISLGCIVALTLLLMCGAYILPIPPSNDRDWSTDNSTLAYAEISDGVVTIHNVRNNTYRSVLDYTPRYYDKTVQLGDLRSVDFVYEPFSSLAAHTFLSFGLSDDSRIAVSVETRREKGEFFSIWKGLAKRFELMYVIADEKDVLKLRTNYRKDDVYAYQLNLTPEQTRELFVSMLERANFLSKKPEFYHTVWSNCTSNLFDHIYKVTGRRVWGWGSMAPKVSDRTLYNRGFMDSKKSFEDLKKEAYVSEKAHICGDCENFSEFIRR